MHDIKMKCIGSTKREAEEPPGYLYPSDRAVGQISQSRVCYITDQSLSACLLLRKVTCEIN